MNKKVILMILDGWGNSPDPKVSAIDHANTPFIDGLHKTYPVATLRTDGLHVGLPEGQMGIAIEKDTLKDEKVLVDALKYASDNNKNVHFLGLLSDGGVHAHTSHLRGFIDAANKAGVNSFVHAFTDGRDVDPKSGKGYVKDLENYIEGTKTKIATVTGRYYAMDRDTRWERVQLAYDAIVNGSGTKTSDPTAVIQEHYDNDVTDEFIKPLIVTNNSNEPVATVQKDDVVIFFNFRTDRGRELTEMLNQKDFPEYNTKKIDLYYVTITNYSDAFKGIKVIFNKDNITETLGEVLAKAGKKQIRIAETEKYPHVTFFFSGGQEAPFEGESRILKNSPKVATYDLKPEMSAFELTDALVPELKKGDVDFVCLNFANGDMVGHTGIMEAAVKACEAVDSCVKEVVTTALDNGYTTLLIADHGNCETMINPDGSPNTAHTTNPVPVILIDNELKTIKDGVLVLP